MTLPQPVPDAALHRLRRSYALLMLLLGLPVLAAVVYVLVLQFEIVSVGTQRQIAMSTDRRVTRLDAVLAPLRDNLLRLRNATMEPAIAPAVAVDRDSLAATADGQGYTLDALPEVLHESAPQVMLAGPQRHDERWRHEAVDLAALFAQQARLVTSGRGAFRRVYYIDASATQLWIHPWVGSEQLLAELGARDVPEALRALASRHARASNDGLVFRDAVLWRVQPDGVISATAALSLRERFGTVTAELPAGALDGAKVEAGIGRFWVLDGDGTLVWDYKARSEPAGSALDAAVPVIAPDTLAQATSAPLAVRAGALLLSARPSSVAPWRAVYASDEAHVRQLVLRDVGPFAAGGALLLLLFLATATMLWRRYALPSLRLVDYLHRKAFDAAAAEPALPLAWVPWMQLTRDTFDAAREARSRELQAVALKSAIVDHALAAIISTDAQGRIVEFNPAAESMFGRRRGEVIGRPVAEVTVPPRHRAGHEAAIARMRAGGDPHMMGRRVEMTGMRADGSEFPVEVVLWRTDLGGESHFTASLTDLSERRAAAEQIERQREALRQSEKLTAMGSLLAGVAHELNNPLAIVMGRAGLLEEKCEGAPDLQGDAKRIREAAERCGRIVRTFLNMARQRPTERRNVQLNDLARAAADMLAYTLRSHGIELQLELEPELPEVSADADQIGQVVLNLLVNAQQALVSSPAEGLRRIRLSTGVEARRRNREPRVWLRVADTGPGVPPALHERIFEPFFTTKPEGIGTGLGLAVSRSLVREHGGQLGLEISAAGAVFRMSLPISGRPGEVTEPGALAGAEGAGPARVLVVDDEAEIAELMRAMLESAGFEVATAESGAVALELLEEARFDAIVCDLRMPDMDGTALWREVNERQPSLARRLLFVTGDMLSPGAEAFLAESGCGSLDKPFGRADLVDRVTTLLMG
ncbi:PAS domain-containing sensor histidine kinase [uncultured Piscinibacter sp.]|uniref:hybrid sensor histidine kinase/response regulator n=1 Tax=uncultured Piscinibacter sp. TaxID=1131835 RepID=UPI002605F195|nr:PAS domain-containing sensor histidine kinase [uncultured Piscinibacter sp.]